MEAAEQTFISYTHSPVTRSTQEDQSVSVERHRSDVLWLSNTLRQFGVHTILDQYQEDDPPPSWPQWAEQNIKSCQWVLMICSESYCSHVTGQSEKEGGVDEGRGSRFEGKTIYGLLTDPQHTSKFIPVFLGEKNLDWVPPSLAGAHYYHIQDMQPSPDFKHQDPDFQNLYARLTRQNRKLPPPVGTVVRLPVDTPPNSQGSKVTAGRRQLDHPSDEKKLADLV